MFKVSWLLITYWNSFAFFQVISLSSLFSKHSQCIILSDTRHAFSVINLTGILYSVRVKKLVNDGCDGSVYTFTCQALTAKSIVLLMAGSPTLIEMSHGRNRIVVALNNQLMLIQLSYHEYQYRAGRAGFSSKFC